MRYEDDQTALFRNNLENEFWDDNNSIEENTILIDFLMKEWRDEIDRRIRLNHNIKIKPYTKWQLANGVGEDW